MRRLAPLKYFVARQVQSVPLLRKMYRLINPAKDPLEFRDSDQYWKERYKRGGNSGEGSYGPLARYKASFINDFCERNAVSSAIEFGCGDGNQASLLSIDTYIGVDISEDCIRWARDHLRKPNWTFEILDEYLLQDRERVELGLSLDVIYHLVEDTVYESYLGNLCRSASRFLIVYTSNVDSYDPAIPHVRHRAVVADIERLHPEWTLIRTVSNPFTMEHDSSDQYGSFADFHLFEQRAG